MEIETRLRLDCCCASCSVIEEISRGRVHEGVLMCCLYICFWLWF